MLDGRTAVLLKRINELCDDGNYKVLEREELSSAFPPFLSQGEEGVDSILSYLREKGYIDVKYADKERGIYCLYPLPLGRAYIESEEKSRREERTKNRRMIAVSLISSFFGALLGSALVWGMSELLG